MNPAEDLATTLAAASPVGGAAVVVGTNVFTGQEREEEVAGAFPRVTLLNYGGPPPGPFLGTGTSFFRGMVQARVRSAPDAFAAGETLARGVLTVLHIAEVPGYVAVYAQESQPAYLGTDSSGRNIWTIDFECQWTG